MRSDIRNLSEIRANYLYRSRRGGKRRGFIGFFWLECRLIFRANNGIREISIGVGVFGWIHVGRRARICESMITFDDFFRDCRIKIHDWIKAGDRDRKIESDKKKKKRIYMFANFDTKIYRR